MGMNMSDQSVIDQEMLLDQCGHDRELLKEIVDLFRCDTQRLLLGIRSAVAGQQVGELRNAVHEFKGMASNLGADAVVTAVAQLETVACRADFVAAERACDRFVQELDRLESVLAQLINDGSNGARE